MESQVTPRATEHPRQRGACAVGRGRRAGGDTPTEDAATRFTSTLPSFVEPGLEAFLIDHGVEISATPIQQGGGFLSTQITRGPGLC